MKRLANISRALLVFCFLAFMSMETMAQAVKLTVVPMSPGKLAAIGKSANMATTGLKVFGKGARAYLFADTTGSGATAVTSFTWSLISKPTASNAVLDSTTKQYSSFTADSTGQYVVTVSVNGGAKADTVTFFVSTYLGNPNTSGLSCYTCHSTNNTGWKTTDHALIYTQGIMGQLEANVYDQGTYSSSCWRCHTTGYDLSANNGNFGYLSHADGWDTTAFKGKTKSGSSYLINYGDSSIYKNMVANYSPLVPLASIGCESCHGPGKDHNGDISKIGLSLDAGVCQSCHDAPPRHVSGTFWALSDHATMPLAGKDATSASCFPCHSGSAFVKWVTDGKPATDPNWSAATDASYPITCSVCHDPHSTANPNQLRTVDVDTLRNGYVVPTGIIGRGQLCMNCHRSRYNANSRVTTKAPYYGFVDHYGPHGNPQSDMLFGQNAYQYGDSTITGLNTHTQLADGCVTCHMPGTDHTLTMQDTAGTGVMHDRVDACKECHGAGITKFTDIKATYDYDRNGKIEGVQTEVAGLLALLKARLPIDSLTGQPTLALKDSLKVKNRPDLVQGLYTYAFVSNDGSMGVHNAKYAVALLQKALGFYPTGVSVVSQKTPTTYATKPELSEPVQPDDEY
jgi:formate-dependent nitrite reductase cytochrome c552 subunit